MELCRKRLGCFGGILGEGVKYLDQHLAYKNNILAQCEEKWYQSKKKSRFPGTNRNLNKSGISAF